MKTMPKWLWLCISAILIALCVVGAGYLIGESNNRQIRDRLEFLWPGLMQMSAEDRTLLVRAALTCRLGMKPMESEAIRHCLSNGADGRTNERLNYLIEAKRLAETKPNS